MNVYQKLIVFMKNVICPVYNNDCETEECYTECVTEDDICANDIDGDGIDDEFDRCIRDRSGTGECIYDDNDDNVDDEFYCPDDANYCPDENNYSF